MAFPWTRGDASASISGSESRSRNRRRSNREDEGDNESSVLSQERFHRRMSWAIGSVLMLVVVGVLFAGYYQEFYRPPRVVAGTVRGVEFTMGDLVRRIRVEQGLTGSVDLSRRPFEYLRRLLNAEILRQDASDLGIDASAELVELSIRGQFYPTAQPGQQTDSGQLDREYKQNLTTFLTRSGLTDLEYRGIVEETLRRQIRYLQLGQQIGETVAQIEVEWIRLDVAGEVTATDVMNRLAIEDFRTVAQSVGTSAGFADSSGYVGWVPSGAFEDEIERTLFGDSQTNQPPLPVGAISRPLFTADGIFILRKISDLETRTISAVMRAKLNNNLLEQWENERLIQGTEEGWATMKFNSDLYRWVADQANISAPRNQPAPLPRQPAQR